ncbi:hypothetical protein B0H16DRAFT_1472734 [Mycena metata]|uniref:Uncharacterized protein n=1 Tax=Mycena metata TaxID=1033252 RepID=A0AAD7HLT7_9AGAR|nr:hypothetical protein B0H16DRAFT_1472734 [Mycena metata]
MIVVPSDVMVRMWKKAFKAVSAHGKDPSRSQTKHTLPETETSPRVWKKAFKAAFSPPEEENPNIARGQNSTASRDVFTKDNHGGQETRGKSECIKSECITEPQNPELAADPQKSAIGFRSLVDYFQLRSSPAQQPVKRDRVMISFIMERNKWQIFYYRNPLQDFGPPVLLDLTPFWTRRLGSYRQADLRQGISFSEDIGVFSFILNFPGNPAALRHPA